MVVKTINFYATDWCKSHKIEHVTRTRFNAAFALRNMALFKPKKDECEKCAGYKVGTVAEEDYELHIIRKEEARLEKAKDKKEKNFVLTADMQAVLMAPKSQLSALYYRTKLQVHNMCFYNLMVCFLWNETEGGVNAEEFASIWVYFLEEKFLYLPKPQCNHCKFAAKFGCNKTHYNHSKIRVLRSGTYPNESR